MNLSFLPIRSGTAETMIKAEKQGVESGSNRVLKEMHKGIREFPKKNLPGKRSNNDIPFGQFD